MVNKSDDLFDTPGYLSVKDYVEDIDVFQQRTMWRLPLGMGDRLHFLALKLFVRYSWFSDILCIVYPKNTSPSYEILTDYLKKKEVFDFIGERNLRFPGYYCFFLYKEIVSGGRVYTVRGQGVAADKSTALSRALGEMIERMISGFCDTNTASIFLSPQVMMKRFSVVYPPKYHRFLEVQKNKYAKLRHNPKHPLKWFCGTNLITHELTYIPREITSWGSKFYDDTDVQKLICVHATTNGSAGYFTKKGAILRGLLEVVQRDGFLVHWLTMIPPKRFMHESLPKEVQKSIGEFELMGISITMLDITAISIPSVLIVAISENAVIPQISLSAASAVTFQEAITNALREMIVGIELFDGSDPEEQKKYGQADFEPFVSNLDKMSRQMYWCGAEKVERFRWFISGEFVSYEVACKRNLICGPSDSAKLMACLSVLKTLGSDYYPVVYYPKNALQETLGFFVAQVYIPKAFPLYLFEGYGTFESERLNDFALSKGISDWQLNQLPHGFP